MKHKHLNEYLEEKTAPVLKNDTRKDFGAGREDRSGRVTVNNVTIVPSERSSLITVKAKAQSTDTVYDVAVRITSVKFVNRYDTNKVELEAVDGTKFFIEPVPINSTDVAVACTCLDFYYTFADWNSRDNALVGNPPPMYVKKTDLPFRNPNKTAGLCKHLIAMERELQLQNILK